MARAVVTPEASGVPGVAKPRSARTRKVPVRAAGSYQAELAFQAYAARRRSAPGRRGGLVHANGLVSTGSKPAGVVS
jgi:hypothetical protein